MESTMESNEGVSRLRDGDKDAVFQNAVYMYLRNEAARGSTAGCGGVCVGMRFVSLPSGRGLDDSMAVLFSSVTALSPVTVFRAVICGTDSQSRCRQ